MREWPPREGDCTNEAGPPRTRTGLANRNLSEKTSDRFSMRSSVAFVSGFAPVVLCNMEGRTCGEAAEVLRCPVGTIKSRLATARERLRRRLGRLDPASLPESKGGEGIGFPLAVPVPLPIPLVEATVAAAVGRATAITAARLAVRALNTMFMSKLKLAILIFLTISSLAGIAVPLAPGASRVPFRDRERRSPCAGCAT